MAFEGSCCGRGGSEKQISELKHGLAIDRTIDSTCRANQLRTLLTAAVYVLRRTAAAAQLTWVQAPARGRQRRLPEAIPLPDRRVVPERDDRVVHGRCEDRHVTSHCRIGLIGCVKSKRHVASAARDLYVSTLFAGRRRFVERSCERWFILSAEHGLVAPDQVLVPYERALKNAGIEERRLWSERVLRQIDAVLGSVSGAIVEIHAGAEYRDFGLAGGLRARGASIEVPTQGLSFGEQLAFYKQHDVASAQDARARAAT